MAGTPLLAGYNHNGSGPKGTTWAEESPVEGWSARVVVAGCRWKVGLMKRQDNWHRQPHYWTHKRHRERRMHP